MVYMDRMSWATCRLPPPAVKAFIIFLAVRNCLMSLFTSCTVVPLPFATRFFLLPLRMV